MLEPVVGEEGEFAEVEGVVAQAAGVEVVEFDVIEPELGEGDEVGGVGEGVASEVGFEGAGLGDGGQFGGEVVVV